MIWCHHFTLYVVLGNMIHISRQQFLRIHRDEQVKALVCGLLLRGEDGRSSKRPPVYESRRVWRVLRGEYTRFGVFGGVLSVFRYHIFNNLNLCWDYLNTTLQVTSKKKSIRYNLPIQIGFFVYQYAKLRMLAFFFDVIDHFISREDYCLLEMDTGNFRVDVKHPSPVISL